MLFHAQQWRFLVVLERARHQVEQRMPVRRTAAVGALAGVGEVGDQQADAARGDGGAELLVESVDAHGRRQRSEEHTSELQSLIRISYAVFCLKKKIQTKPKHKSPLSLSYKQNSHSK